MIIWEWNTTMRIIEAWLIASRSRLSAFENRAESASEYLRKDAKIGR